MDSNCNVNCPALKTQSIAQGNKCVKSMTVKEEVDGCESGPPPEYAAKQGLGRANLDVYGRDVPTSGRHGCELACLAF